MKKRLVLNVIVILLSIFFISCSESNISEEDAINEFSDYDQAALVATSALKDVMRSPSSLEVHSIIVTEREVEDADLYNYMVKIDYSAENGFGGTTRDTIHLEVEAETFELFDDWFDPFDENTLSINELQWATKMDDYTEIDVEKIMNKMNE